FVLSLFCSHIFRLSSYLPLRSSHLLKWGANNSLVDYLATHSKVVFTSSTLSFQDSEQYFSGQLKNLPMKFHQLKGPYDYGNFIGDRKSTRLNSSHVSISYAVFCLIK